MGKKLMKDEKQKKRKGSAFNTAAYVYAILLKVADKSMSINDAVERIMGAF